MDATVVLVLECFERVWPPVRNIEPGGIGS